MQIQISWLLQKPTDLDLHCLQRQGISGFSRTRVNTIYQFIKHVLDKKCLFLRKVEPLTFTTLLGNSADDTLMIFLLFCQITTRLGFDILCKLSRMKYKILFSGKNKKNITSVSSAELAQRVVKVMVTYKFITMKPYDFASHCGICLQSHSSWLLQHV